MVVLLDAGVSEMKGSTAVTACWTTCVGSAQTVAADLAPIMNAPAPSAPVNATVSFLHPGPQAEIFLIADRS